MNPRALKQTTDFIDTWLAFQVEYDDAPGMVVAIRQNDQLLYSRSFGSFSSVDMVFNLGSQAKMFTAVLVLQLMEQGKLRITDTAVTYLPWLLRHLDKRMHYVTIEQLLWHGAGLIRDGARADFWQGIGLFPDRAELQRLILESNLVLEGGLQLKYSNLGYALLGQIIEVITGNSYSDLAEKRIIIPLGLESTFVGSVPDHVPVAPGFMSKLHGQRLQATSNIATNSLTSTTGWYASATDSLQLLESLHEDSGQLLKSSTKRQMIQGQRHHWQIHERRGTIYGLGLMTQEIGQRHIYGHGGTFVSHCTTAYFDPAEKLSIVVLAPYRDAPVHEVLFGLFDMFAYFDQYALPISDRLERFTGTLENALGVRHMLAIGSDIISTPLDSWTPLDSTEKLEVIDDHTLKITKAYDIAAIGEVVRYTFKGNAIKSVNYAGITLWPQNEGNVPSRKS